MTVRFWRKADIVPEAARRSPKLTAFAGQ